MSEEIENELFPDIRRDQLADQRPILITWQFIDLFLNYIAERRLRIPATLSSKYTDKIPERVTYYLASKFYPQDLRSLIQVFDKNTSINFKGSRSFCINHFFQDWNERDEMDTDPSPANYQSIWNRFYSKGVVTHLQQNRGNVGHSAVIVQRLLNHITRINGHELSFYTIGFGHPPQLQALIDTLQQALARVYFVFASLDSKFYLIEKKLQVYDIVDCQTQQTINLQNFYLLIHDYYQQMGLNDEKIAVSHLSLTFIFKNIEKITRQRVNISYLSQNCIVTNYLHLEENQQFQFLYETTNHNFPIIVGIIRDKQYHDFANYIIKRYIESDSLTLFQTFPTKQNGIDKKLLIVFSKIFQNHWRSANQFQKSYYDNIRRIQVEPLLQIFHSIFQKKLQDQVETLKDHPYMVKRFMDIIFQPRETTIHQRYSFIDNSPILAFLRHNYLDQIARDDREKIIITVSCMDDFFVLFPSKRQYVYSMGNQTHCIPLEGFQGFFSIGRQNHYTQKEGHNLVVDIYYPNLLQNVLQQHFKSYQNYLMSNNFWMTDKLLKADRQLMSKGKEVVKYFPKTHFIFHKNRTQKLIQRKTIKPAQIKTLYHSVLSNLQQNGRSERIIEGSMSRLPANMFHLVFQLLLINKQKQYLLNLVRATSMYMNLKNYFLQLASPSLDEMLIYKLMRQVVVNDQKLQCVSIVANTLPKKMLLKELLLQFYPRIDAGNLNKDNVLILLQYGHKIFAVHDIRNGEFILKYPYEQCLSSCKNDELYQWLQRPTNINGQNEFRIRLNEQNQHFFAHFILLPQTKHTFHDTKIIEPDLKKTLAESIEGMNKYYQFRRQKVNSKTIYIFNHLKMKIFNHSTEQATPQNIRLKLLFDLPIEEQKYQTNFQEIEEKTKEEDKNQWFIFGFFGYKKAEKQYIDIRNRINYRTLMLALKKIKRQYLYPFLIQEFNLYRQQQYICSMANGYNFILDKSLLLLQKIINIDLQQEKIIFLHYHYNKSTPHIHQVSIFDLFNQNARMFQKKQFTELELWGFLFKKAFIGFVQEYLMEDESGFDIRKILKLMLGDSYESALFHIKLNLKHKKKDLFNKFVSHFEKKKKIFFPKMATYLSLHHTQPYNHCLKLVTSQTCLFPEKGIQENIIFEDLAKQDVYLGAHMIAPQNQHLFKHILDFQREFEKQLQQ